MLGDVAEHPALTRTASATIAPLVSSCSIADRSPDAQPARDVRDHRLDDGQPVRAAEQRAVRVVVGHLGFELGALRDVRRVGHHQVDTALEPGEQRRGRSRRPGAARSACRRRSRVVGVAPRPGERAAVRVPRRARRRRAGHGRSRARAHPSRCTGRGPRGCCVRGFRGRPAPNRAAVPSRAAARRRRARPARSISPIAAVPRMYCNGIRLARWSTILGRRRSRPRRPAGTRPSRPRSTPSRWAASSSASTRGSRHPASSSATVASMMARRRG